MTDAKPVSGDVVPSEAKPAERLDLESNEILLGQWYWVTFEDSDDNEYETLMCVMKLGSNVAHLEGPSTKYVGSTSNARILYKDFDRRCRHEPDAESILNERVLELQGRTRKLMAQIQAETRRLGLEPDTTSTETGITLAGGVDVKAHQRALVKAKDETLPELFEAVKTTNEAMAQWMDAQTFSLRAECGDLRTLVSAAEDRIFNIELYAGLTETVRQIQDGQPAGIDDRLHVMQRKLYMDEECLLDYRTGGMEFKNIDAFDQWLLEPQNLQRILPFPRTIVALQVRRKRKERGSSLHGLITLALEQEDRSTFFYIRNGDRVYWLQCDLEFGDHLFPEKDYELFSNEPLMAYAYCGRVERIMRRSTWEAKKAEHDELQAQHAAWEKANPDKHRFHNPHHDLFHSRDITRFEPFDQDNVHYDEIMGEIADKAKYFNRIILIIQGLLDRSPVLHPHHECKTWEEAARRQIELVYDGSKLLRYGSPPDYEAYAAGLRKHLEVGSVTIGQEDAWLRREAKREMARRDRNWRTAGSDREIEHFKPYHDPGPGELSRIDKLTRNKATYRWLRGKKSIRWREDLEEQIKSSIAVARDLLFNVSAYQPGDFRQFYEDPTTRQHYLRWAPTMLEAEEWHAGNRTILTPEERWAKEVR